ncbi:hypothetical protein [Streptomyces sp. MS2.AVA.5]|uniref:Uncharacterized protein n=1 Tax=Streptomyces achmelvichensis TaxID=3134111 RepID=A0ACC6PLB2_9ACTN
MPTPRAGRSTGRSSPGQGVDIVGLRDVEAIVIVGRGSTDQVVQNIGWRLRPDPDEAEHQETEAVPGKVVERCC